MSRFQPYQHPDFQAEMFNDGQVILELPQSDESFVFHAAHYCWFKAIPYPPFWAPATLADRWIGVVKDESEALNRISQIQDTSNDCIVFYDLETQLMKST